MEFNTTVRYQDSHEWAKRDGELVVVGISDFAQDELGDVVFVELPDVGTTLKKGESFGVIESPKAASDLFMPVGGEIVEVNGELGDAPETVNRSPFDEGWIIKIKPMDVSEYDQLMDADAYRKLTEESH